MDKDHVLLKLVLDRIGFGNIAIDNFNARKILQKKIYILQLTGVDLDYRYNWYLQGPYCPTLAHTAFTLREEIKYDDEFNKYELNSKTKSKFDTLDKIVSLPDTLETNEPEWLEVLASLHYLKHIAYWAGKDKPEFDEVFEKLKESKPHLADKMDLAKVAWERLDDAGLVKNKTLE
ncbi:MAG: hypothetical protein H8D56_19610 [Planctomycetes bacterium]|nr:hypothetical protein [Planctomycetota bacterium]MBL7146779.1 hypothetical protein [Phycisphaerae bacterium]